MKNFVEASTFCHLVTDGTHNSPKKTNDGVLLVTSKNITNGKLDLSKSYYISKNDAIEINKRSKVNKFDILISMIGTVGEVCFIDHEPNFVVKNVGILKNKDKFHAKWLYFYLKSQEAQNIIKERLNGTTQQYLSLGELRKLPILKPISENHLINTVEILDNFEKKITLNTQTNQTLEQIAQATFKHWFIDFAPVHAKANALASGASPEQAELATMACLSGKTAEKITALKTQDPTAYHQLQQTAAAFPSEFVETEMGKVPRGWEVKPINEICSIVYGKGLPKNQLKSSGYPVYGANGVIGYYDQYLYKTRQVLIGCRGTVGQVYVSQPYSYITSNSLIIEDTKTILNLYFLELYLKNLDLSVFASGSVQPQITIQNLSRLKIFIPNKEILDLFSSLVEPMYQLTYKNDDEKKTLSEIRDFLLPKLLNGEIEL
ncbi:restriction endonuclease subunit S [Gallibacterium anatis]|uniref:restriction endonuclease subunit S n=1 Tax=Gallibacterium anatis TaxID=750 RepID=UPI003004C1B5